jgi:crotonobetainyl-CoA:carnitine CoA-transferase CaiB-like acyl-CoA transferase
MTSTRPTLPLEGYTLLDLSGSVATATCAKLFADFGARVLNIEAPGRGHPTRGLPPHRADVAAPESSGLHALLSPHKESVALDLEDSTGRERLWDLVRAADVVLESEPAGALEGRGLGFQELARHASGLILCSLTWFGQTGPLAGAPANDASISCHLGLVKSLGRPEGPPILPSGHQVQIIGGVTGFIATSVHLLAGLLAGERTSRHLDVSLFEAALCLTEVSPVAFVRGGQPLPRLGLNRFIPTFPGGIYRAREGWIGVTALTPAQWRDFCELIGVPQLGPDPRYQTSLARLFDADALDELLAPALLQRTAVEWFHEGQARRIPIALVPTMAEVFESEQLRALDAFREVEHPDLGALRVPAAPFRLRRTPARRDGPVHRLGDHRPGPSTTSTDGHSASTGTVPATRTPIRTPHGRPDLLCGIRVVDLSMGWAGPLAARHLADMGAEVIKVEACDRFDWWRGWDHTSERIAEGAAEKSPAFNTMNRNKLGITLDLTRPRGAELLRHLVAVSDVVIENYSAGVLPKLGLDDTVLRRKNSLLVMLSMPPFGAGGPWHHYRAYGSTVEQASGLPHLQGAADDPPVMQHVALGDPVAGIYAAAAVLLGLLQQRRTGEGQFIDMSQVEATTSIGLHGVATQALLGEPPPRLGSRHPVHAPQGVYRCRGDDQWLALTIESEPQWRCLVDLLGDPELASGRLASVEARRRAHDAIDARLAAWLAPRERDEVVAALLERGIPAAGVIDVQEVLGHPQLEARGFWQWLEREHVGALPHPAAPYRAGFEPAGIEIPAPTLGQHNAEVLAALLGISEPELRELEREGIIGSLPRLRAA